MKKMANGWVVLTCVMALMGSFSVCAATSKLLPCSSPKDRLVIAAVGDILLQSTLQRRACYAGFSSLWKQAIPYIQAADVAFANVGGPMAYGVSKSGKMVKDPGHRLDGEVYTSYPLFNYHPKLAKSLKHSGFDVIGTANEHALDRSSIGIDRTIRVLNHARLQFTGTKTRQGNDSWYALSEHNGFKVAWIACTETTNGLIDEYDQVLYCFKPAHQKLIFNLISDLRRSVDAIMFVPHWGMPSQNGASKQQVELAKRVLDAGATAVIGSHPRVTQPIARYRTSDGRDTLIAYGLGNFVSFQGSPQNRSTIILYLTLSRHQGKTQLTDVAYVPAYMNNQDGLTKLGLKVLHLEDKASVGFRILNNKLDPHSMLLTEAAFNQHFCKSIS